jgi:hypothetical protein
MLQVRFRGVCDFVRKSATRVVFNAENRILGFYRYDHVSLSEKILTEQKTVRNDCDADLLSISMYILGFVAFALIIGFDLGTFIPAFFAFLLSFLSIGVVFYMGAQFLWSKSLPRFESRLLHELASRRLVEIHTRDKDEQVEFA